MLHCIIENDIQLHPILVIKTENLEKCVDFIKIGNPLNTVSALCPSETKSKHICNFLI